MAGTSESSQVPGFQPTKAPSATPSTAAMTVESPTSTTVHGSDCPITSVTGAG